MRVVAPTNSVVYFVVIVKSEKELFIRYSKTNDKERKKDLFSPGVG